MWHPTALPGWPHVVAHTHMCSWLGACATAVAALAMAVWRVALVTWQCRSTVSSARGGDAAAVPANGAEGDRGSR
jgi:hypothetical protein